MNKTQTNFNEYYQELDQIMGTSHLDDDESEKCCERLINYREKME